MKTLKKWLWKIYRGDSRLKNPYDTLPITYSAGSMSVDRLAAWEANWPTIRGIVRKAPKEERNGITVKFKKLRADASVPRFGKTGDAGADLTAVSIRYDDLYRYHEYGTGVAVKLPPGHMGLLMCRSSASNVPQVLTNCVGLLDENYVGEIRFRFKDLDTNTGFGRYKIGDRIGQLVVVPIPAVIYEEVSELEETNRGAAGFGSSGK